jgi:hypothetical protein
MSIIDSGHLEVSDGGEEGAEEAAERYHDSIKTMTRLLEDKREPQQRKKFFGIF